MEGISDKLTIENIEKNVDIVRSLYDQMRVIDPSGKKVVLCNKDVFIERNGSCFSENNKEKVCANCISVKTIKDINNKSTFMKLENVDEKMYLISAVPFDFQGKTLVVELIKDVTDTLFYGDSIISGTYKVDNIVNDMKKLATKDALTGIYNRRFIDERLPIDIDICLENKEPISIIMADMDYFKRINDTFGHTTGDRVLRLFTKCIKKCMRNKKDWIARYGGEEFIICIPGANSKIALKIAKRMLDAINKKQFVHNEENINITASFGIATLYNERISAEEFLARADEKLYIAKETGRNKVVI